MCKGMLEWKEELLQEGYREGCDAGRQGGREEGEARLGSLVNLLLSQNKIQEVLLVTSDAKAREKYYKKYNI